MTSLLVLGYMFKIKSTGGIILLGGLVGFFMIPTPSIVISYASEVVFPIDEGSSAGYLFATSQTFGFIFGFGSISYLNRTEDRSRLVGYLVMGMLFLAFVSGIWVKEKLKKWKFERTQYIQASIEKSEIKASFTVEDESLK